MISLTILGNGGGMPIPERFLSAQQIKYRGRSILIDCGEGTQVAIRKFNTGFKNIDIIFLSHMHGDHIFGLPGLLMTMGNSGRTETVSIIGPEGTNDVIENLIHSITYLPFEVQIMEKPESPLFLLLNKTGLQIIKQENSSLAEIVVSTLELDHTSPCMGYCFNVLRRPKFSVDKAIDLGIPKMLWNRLQRGETIDFEGKRYNPEMVLSDKRKGIKLSCITDTRPIDEIPDFIRESDLFLCESTYATSEDKDKAIKNKHMLFEDAADLALKGNVKELILTHFGAGLDHPEKFISYADKIFANTEIGFDGLRKELVFK